MLIATDRPLEVTPLPRPVLLLTERHPQSLDVIGSSFAATAENDLVPTPSFGLFDETGQILWPSITLLGLSKCQSRQIKAAPAIRVQD